MTYQIVNQHLSASDINSHLESLRNEKQRGVLMRLFKPHRNSTARAR